MLNRNKLSFTKIFFNQLIYKINHFLILLNLDSKSIKPIQKILIQEKILIIKAI